MYESHWKLTRKPFDGAESESYYPSETHQGALLKLRYVLESRYGGAVLAGGPGMGKTLLLRQLQRQLPAEFSPFVHLIFPQLPAEQLLALLAHELGTGSPHDSLNETIQALQAMLQDNHRQGRHAVIAIDEAQLLEERKTFEALRMLLNFDVEGKTPLTLLLVGQPSMLPRLERIPSLEERLTVKTLLRPFTLEETVSYVSHRLQAAGGRGAIFENDAWETLQELTQGYPRRINRLCDLALLIGYAEELSQISAAQLEAVNQELVTIASE